MTRQKAIVAKRVIDLLIRAKMKRVIPCHDVKPLPVAWQARDPQGINWTVPGWVGDSSSVNDCVSRIGDYLDLLRSEFDVPDES